jgi:hypothetical protein
MREHDLTSSNNTGTRAGHQPPETSVQDTKPSVRLRRPEGLETELFARQHAAGQINGYGMVGSHAAGL